MPLPARSNRPGELGHHRLRRRPPARWLVASAVLIVAGSSLARAQSAPESAIVGTWKFELKQGNNSGPRTVVVRPDSSASYGTETVRWRFQRDSLLLALGGEWVSYGVKIRGKNMTLSGGDLTEPITFQRIGPPTPRPDSVPVPPDPDKTSS